MQTPIKQASRTSSQHGLRGGGWRWVSVNCGARVGAMGVADLTKHSTDDIQCLATNGEPRIFATVHASLVDIAHMRISIERGQLQIRRSSHALLESTELLRRLRLERF